MGTDGKAEYDVFISYAREDHEFVRQLKQWLEEAGFDVWIDEERMRVGGSVQDAVGEALERSRNAVFVLSRYWLKSDWGPWELRAYHDEHKRRPKIAILRTPIKEKNIPNILSGRFRLEWFEGAGASDDALFWQLFYNLRGDQGRGLGDPSDWPRLGREARLNAKAGGGSALPAGTTQERTKKNANRARWGPARAALRCDRAPQWKVIGDHADLEWHEALFVQGADHEAPELFLEAVQQFYPERPHRRIVPVAWDSERLPSTKAQFFDELARALGCSARSLVQSLGDELRKQFLVLVHRPQLPAALRSDSLIRYYTLHMPELIAQLGPTAKFLKLIQGIVWSDTEQPEAEAWIAGMEAHPALPIESLAPLQKITREEVETWSRTLRPSADRTAIVNRVLAGETTSAVILDRIIEEYRKLEGSS